MKFIFSILLLLVLFSCKEEINKEDKSKPIQQSNLIFRENNFSKEEILNSIYGKYSTPFNGYGRYSLKLFNDGHFEYNGGGCTGSEVDTGYFKMHLDTIFFNSEMLDYYDSLHEGHTQLAHLKYAVLKKRLVEVKRIDCSIILYKEKIGYDNIIISERNGSKEILKLDTLNRKIEEGFYRNYKIYNGYKKVYEDKNDYFGTTTYYKNGKIDTSRN